MGKENRTLQIWYIYHISAIKKNEILPFEATQMDLEGIMLSEISQREKGKYYMIPLIGGSKKIQQAREYNRRETDSQRTNQLPVTLSVREKEERNNSYAL